MELKKKRNATHLEVLETAILMALSLAKIERNYLLAYYGIGEGESALVKEISIWAKEFEDSISQFHFVGGADWYEEVDAFIVKKLEQFETVWLVRGNKVLNYQWLGYDGKFTVIDRHAQTFETEKLAGDYVKRLKYRGLKIVEVFRDRHNDINILQ